MEPLNEKLTEEEKKRNSHGPMLVYNYIEECLGGYSAPSYFPPVKENHAQCVALSIDDIKVPVEKLVKGAYPGVVMNIYYPGFPTFKHLKYTVSDVYIYIYIYDVYIYIYIFVLTKDVLSCYLKNYYCGTLIFIHITLQINYIIQVFLKYVYNVLT